MKLKVQRVLFAVCLLLVGLASAQPVPYVPYRLETDEYHRHVEREQRGALYIVQSTPAPRSIIPEGEPLRLSVTFSKPLDLQSVPPLSTEWSLKTPGLVIDHENLSEFGAVSYFPNASKIDNRVIPPNTLVFEMRNLELKSHEFLSCELTLFAQKSDRLPTEPLEEATLTAWDFRVEPPHLKPLEGRVALALEEIETSYADTSRFRDLSLLRGQLHGERLRLLIVDGPLPSLQPYKQRELLLDIPIGEGADSELILDWKGGEVLYSEWDFEPSEPAQRPVSANASRFWKAEDGAITLVEDSQGGMRLYLDLNLVANAQETVGSLRLFGEVEIASLPRR